MNKHTIVLSALGVVLAAIIIWPVAGKAQMKQSSQGMDMSGKESSTAAVADDGFCPVCLLDGMKMKGSDHFVTEYKGKIYKFYSFDMQKEFMENPEKFIQK